MGTSSPEGKATIKNWVSNLEDIQVVIDIGAGKGTYANLLKHKGKILSSATIIGIEAWAPYIEKFNLHTRYDHIINQDARLVDYQSFKRIDLAVAGDVLEHVSKIDAIKLVNNISKIARYMIISIPIVFYPQHAINDNPFEEHIKDDWSHAEILDTWGSFIINSETGKEIGVYLLKFNPLSHMLPAST